MPRAWLLKPGEVGIVLAPNPGPAEVQAAKDLRSLFEEFAGTAPDGTVARIILGVLNAEDCVGNVRVRDAARLRKCPNNDQAYLIRFQGEGQWVIAGLTGKGVYYGTQTLRQLLRPFLTPQMVKVPLVTVTDWPDFEVRGMWTSPFEAIPAMAALKLNYQKSVADYPRTGKWSGELPKPQVNAGTLATFRSYAMGQCLQLLYHLNYFNTYWGIYSEYPDLKGKGKEAVPGDPQFKYAGRDIAVICASNPRWKPILAGMLKQVAAQGLSEVTVWLSEFAGQCQCPECLKSTQVQLESKLVVDAWREARRDYPHLTLRIFFSQGDASPATAKALADLPPEVKIERVYRTHKPFLDAAAQGRWVLSFNGSYLGNTGRLYFAPECVRGPIEQGYEHKLKGVLSICVNTFAKGRLPPGSFASVQSFPMSAVAEWSWNVHGRTAGQFMEAYSTLAGYNDPTLFAQWVQALSAVTDTLAAKPVTALPVNLVPREIPGMPGAMASFQSPFRAIGEKIRARAPFAVYKPADIAVAKASSHPVLAMAEKLNQPAPAIETRHFMACLQMHEQLTALSAAVVALDPTSSESREKLRSAWREFEAAASGAVAAKEQQLRTWELTSPDAGQLKRDLEDEWREVHETMQTALRGLIGTVE
jgi:hypothetical protein